MERNFKYIKHNNMKKNILILVGIPASGKSTFSKKFLTENPNYIRINRDDIRKMIRNSQMLNFEGEKMVTEIEYNLASIALNNNHDIIWDNTHLNSKYIDSIVNKFSDRANISFKIFDISLEEAIIRDNNRESKVGEDVIRMMYEKYIKLVQTYKFN